MSSSTLDPWAFRQDVNWMTELPQNRFYGFSEVRPEGFLCPQQVHGARILSEAEYQVDPRGDGVIGTRCAVRTADCVPILLDYGDRVGAVHAGWRGIAGGIVEAIPMPVQRVIIGPAIGREDYEVGPEVVEALSRVVSAKWMEQVAHPGQGDRSYVDVQMAVIGQLAELYVDPEVITVVRISTYRSHLPSYRREGKDCRHLWSWIDATAR